MSNEALIFVGFFLEVTHVSPVHIAFIGQTEAHGQHNFKSGGVREPSCATGRNRTFISATALDFN